MTVLRETLLDEAHFDATIRRKEEATEKAKTALKSDPGQFLEPEGVYERLFRYEHHGWIARYSRGASIDELKDRFPSVVQAAEELRRVDTEGIYSSDFKPLLDNYVTALWLLSQAYLLSVEATLIARLLAYIGNEGKDLLFERLVAKVAPGVTRTPAKKLLYPKAYQPLYEALDAPAEQQAALMQQFLKKWYKRMSDAGWHDAHKVPGSGFFGYWCWEAAGVAHAFNIDDSSFRDLPHYPRDLAEYARNNS